MLIQLDICPFFWILYYTKFITMIAIICVALTVSSSINLFCFVSARFCNSIRTRRRGWSQERPSLCNHFAHSIPAPVLVGSRLPLLVRAPWVIQRKRPWPEGVTIVFENPTEAINNLLSEIHGECQFPVAWDRKTKSGDFVNTVDISVGRNQIYKNHWVSEGEIKNISHEKFSSDLFKQLPG